MTYGNVWLVCDGILSNKNLARTKNGLKLQLIGKFLYILKLALFYRLKGLLVAEYNEEVDLIYTSLAIVKKVFETLTVAPIRKPASNCSENGLEWEIGKKAYE
jgi:hypothetical protein